LPTTGIRGEDALIELFLSVYDRRSWAGDLAVKTSPERVMDGGVELLATRKIDDVTLAIEHTLIEPFVGDKTDFHNHFKQLALRLRKDGSLAVPGHALYVNAPVNVLPHRSDWQGIITDIAEWLRVNSRSFSAKPMELDCPSPHHPNGKVRLQVRLQPLGKDGPHDPVFPPIVQRYGDMKIGDSVEKALLKKLPKLVKTNVSRRLLMLERDQGWVAPDDIYKGIDRLRSRFPDLASVHEIWIADTATFFEKGEWVEFSRRENSADRWSFAFNKGVLLSVGKNNMPVFDY
jgi:hypothetical protein